MTGEPDPYRHDLEETHVDEAALPRAARRLPHPAHCPPWCAECSHYDTDPPGAVLHRGPADTVGVYDEGCALVEAYVRAAFWDKAPDWIGTDPADLERPYVEVSVPTGGEFQMSLNPGQARAFAAALLWAADTADTAHTLAPR